MRFTSSRDFQRALERGVRKAGLPMAFSGGFHPHPKISYANAAPTGAASEAEYVEIQTDRVVDPQQVRNSLHEALPVGLDIVSVDDVTEEHGALADRLQASVWVMRSAPKAELGPGAAVAVDLPRHVEDAVRALWEKPEFLVTRMMKRGPREIDVRGALLSLHAATPSAIAQTGPEGSAAAAALNSADARPGEVWVLASVRHTTPTVRPEEIWTALREVSGADLPKPISTRLRQGQLLADGSVSRALEG